VPDYLQMTCFIVRRSSSSSC